MSNEQSVKCATNTPPGVGADSSRPYPNIINYVHSRHQIRVSVSPHTHSPSHFVCVYVYTGTINRPLQLRTACQLHGEHPANNHVHPRNTILSHHKNHTFALQIPTFRNAKNILSHRKNHTFTPQKPIGDKLGGSQKRFVKIIIVAETNISHTQNKTLSSLLEYHFLNHYNRLYRVRITI